jgi:hypothetical protein
MTTRKAKCKCRSLRDDKQKKQKPIQGVSASVEMTGLARDISGFQRVLEKSF